MTQISNSVRQLLTRSAENAAQIGADIQAELEFHLAERTDELMSRGMSEVDARESARERFGNPERIAIECYAAHQQMGTLWSRLHVTVTVALLLAVGVLLWQSMNNQVATARAAVLPPPIASMLDNDWTGDVTGHVRDDHGQPIAGASVLIVVKTWPDQSYFQRAYQTTTGRDGGFWLEDVYPLNDEYEVKLTAVTPGRVLTSTYRPLTTGELKPVEFMLPPSGYFAIRLVSTDWQPLSGVEVFPHRRLANDGSDHSVYFDSAHSMTCSSDADGLVELPYFQAGETATISLHRPGGAWFTHEVIVPALGQVVTIPVEARKNSNTEET